MWQNSAHLIPGPFNKPNRNRETTYFEIWGYCCCGFVYKASNLSWYPNPNVVVFPSTYPQYHSIQQLYQKPFANRNIIFHMFLYTFRRNHLYIESNAVCLSSTFEWQTFSLILTEYVIKTSWVSHYWQEAVKAKFQKYNIEIWEGCCADNIFNRCWSGSTRCLAYKRSFVPT